MLNNIIIFSDSQADLIILYFQYVNLKLCKYFQSDTKVKEHVWRNENVIIIILYSRFQRLPTLTNRIYMQNHHCCVLIKHFDRSTCHLNVHTRRIIVTVIIIVVVVSLPKTNVDFTIIIIFYFYPPPLLAPINVASSTVLSR